MEWKCMSELKFIKFKTIDEFKDKLNRIELSPYGLENDWRDSKNIIGFAIYLHKKTNQLVFLPVSIYDIEQGITDFNYNSTMRLK